jgi:membrane protein DedA with SNARE-associated domain
MLEPTFLYLETLISSDVSLISAFAVWLVTFLAGENGGLLSLSLAHQGYLTLATALIFTFLGSLTADVFWYVMTATAIRPYFERWFKKRKKNDKSPDQKSFLELANKHPYLILIFIKFLVGLRLILTVYIVAKHRIPFFKYLLCNIIANVLFVGVMSLFVWTIGESLGLTAGEESSILKILSVIFIITLAGNVALRLFQKVVAKLLRAKSEKVG